MNRILTTILVMLLLAGSASAQVAIKSFSTNPDSIVPGKQVEVILQIENVGDADIQDILVKLDLTNVPFAPIGSASEKVIDELEEDDVTNVVFELIALPDATSQIYKIPVKITHSGINQDSLVSLMVSGQAKLDIVLDSSELVKVGDKGNVIVKLVNNGLTDIKFLSISLDNGNGYELLSTGTVYVGQVDVDDFETAEFDMIARDEDPQLLFRLNYKDASNKDYSQSKIVSLNVYNLEEAKQLGLVSSSYLSIIIGAVAVVLVGFFVYRRMRKRKLQL